MKLGVLFSGGKDSTLAAWLAQKQGHEVVCLISIVSENKESYMFHTPSINCVEKQAEVIELPLVIGNTLGVKEKELIDLKEVILRSKEKYCFEGIVTGAVESVYQASRVQEICNELEIECFNPLWQKNGIEILEELIENKFLVVISGVFAFPFDSSWLSCEIDSEFIKKIKTMNEKYKIHVAGEGGEFESLVLNCPLFKKKLKINKKDISGSGNSWRMEAELE